ncbi:hypothetical protein DL96DRAFT_1535569 [Flagelloscypha sp. PMI_526]|nr:hypothetical protein DL96DRAFT_1535569 [Flagelloscypha sp. PMI_526]
MFATVVVALLLAPAALASATMPARRQEVLAAGPVPDGTLPKNWVYQGCWVDGANGRVLQYQQTGIHSPMTIELCVAECQRLNHDGAGLEYGGECWCGDKILNGGALAETDAESSMPCDGAAGEACGSGLRISIYSEYALPVYPVPTVKLVTEPGWVYQGCYKDTDARVFPDFYRLYLGSTDPKFCVNRCAEEGFRVLGVEFGSECWCGTLEQFALAEKTDDSECWSICLGDEASLCGGPNRLGVYVRNPPA